MRRHAVRKAIGLALGLCALAAHASAQPANGFGAGAGVVANGYNLSNAGISSSAGIVLSGDMQFVVNPSWSLNPYLSLSGEAAFDRGGGFASNGVGGFEVRHWRDDWYLGARLAAYSTFVSRNGSSRNLYDPGVGVTLGKELPSGVGYQLGIDLPRVLVPVVGVPPAVLNLQQIEIAASITYRFR
jgi:hypothetical protein